MELDLPVAILGELSPTDTEESACRYVIHGADVALTRFPVGVFGNLRTVDRSEIESYRSIQNLIREYVAAPSAKHPLSIAVFGPPGSGKSFGVSQVAQSAAPGRLHKLEFNLSQITSVDELTAAFHPSASTAGTGPRRAAVAGARPHLSVRRPTNALY